jgi:hypothetical protein
MMLLLMRVPLLKLLYFSSLKGQEVMVAVARPDPMHRMLAQHSRLQICTKMLPIHPPTSVSVRNFDNWKMR